MGIGAIFMWNKEINKCCAYCEHSKALKTKDEVICQKKLELMQANGICASYRYSPLKREPANKD